jgi:hypothetical protein
VARASSNRPPATPVTQPKIAGPREDGPAGTAERPDLGVAVGGVPKSREIQIGGSRILIMKAGGYVL